MHSGKPSSSEGIEQEGGRGRISGRMLTLAWWLALAVVIAVALVPVDSAGQIWLATAAIPLLILFWIVGRPGRLEDGGTAQADVLQQASGIALLMLGVYLSLRYIFWRAFFTLDGAPTVDTLLALTLFLAEVYVLATFLLGIFVNISPLRRPGIPLAEAGKDAARRGPLPGVDVLVPSYNENPELLEITLRAARMMRYPDPSRVSVYLLDDGATQQKLSDRDPAVRETARERRRVLADLCAELGVRYLARERNENAKAGNINFGLAHCAGDLVAILDADHVPTTDFLEWTVPPFLADDKLFLVQTPHNMANQDPVERNLLRSAHEAPTENDMFYQGIQQGLDFWDSTFFCGSAAVLRKRALEESGGISTVSVTEDAETALLLHARGYRSAYIDRPLIAGLQPETYDAFIGQRSRWSQGMLQILLLFNPLRLRGLRWYQRLSYANSCLFWLFPLSRIVFLLAPLTYLLFGVRIYDASATQILAYALPHLIGVYLVLQMLYGRTRWILMSDIYETVQAAHILRGLFQVFLSPRTPEFVVTPKDEKVERRQVSSLAAIYYLLLFLILVGMGTGAWMLFAYPERAPYTAIVLFWNFVNLVVVAGAMGAQLERPQTRDEARIPLRLPATLLQGGHAVPCQVTDVSATGLGLTVPAEGFVPDPEAPALVRLTVPATGREAELEFRIRGGTVIDDDVRAIGLEAAPRSAAERDAHIALMYGSSETWLALTRERLRPRHALSALGFCLRRSLVAFSDHLDFVNKRIVQSAARRRVPMTEKPT